MSSVLTLGYELLENGMYKVKHSIGDNNFKVDAYSIVSPKILKEELSNAIKEDDHILDFTYINDKKGIKQQFLMYPTTKNNLVIDYSLSKKFHVAVHIKKNARSTIKIFSKLLLKNINNGVTSYEKSETLKGFDEVYEFLQIFTKEDKRLSILMGNLNITLIINCYERKFMNRYKYHDEIVNNSAYKFGIYRGYFGKEYLIFTSRNANEETLSLHFTCEGLYEKYKYEGVQAILLQEDILTYDLLGLEYLGNYEKI